MLSPAAGLKYRQLYGMGYMPIIAFLLFVRLVPAARGIYLWPAQELMQGALSLVVRARTEWVGRLLGWLANWNRWSWQDRLGPTPDTSYLTGLFLIPLVLAIVGATLSLLMRDMAARATIEATTRIRRRMQAVLASDLSTETDAAGKAGSCSVRE